MESVNRNLYELSFFFSRLFSSVDARLKTTDSLLLKEEWVLSVL